MSYLSILIASFAGFVIGIIWYSQKIFGKLWMEQSHPSKIQNKSIIKSMIVGFFAVLVMVSVISKLLTLTSTTTITGALQLSFILWLGLIAVPFLNSILWEGRSIQLYLINTLHYLVVIIAIALILTI